MDIYKELGFEGRTEYLEDLSAKFGVSTQKVKELAEVFGEEKDFTFLPAVVEDMAYRRDE